MPFTSESCDPGCNVVLICLAGDMMPSFYGSLSYRLSQQTEGGLLADKYSALPIHSSIVQVNVHVAETMPPHT